MGHRHSPLDSSSTFTEDEDENDEFREPQLLDFDGFLEFDDLDGVHSLMVRTLGVSTKQGAGRRLLLS